MVDMTGVLKRQAAIDTAVKELRQLEIDAGIGEKMARYLNGSTFDNRTRLRDIYASIPDAMHQGAIIRKHSDLSELELSLATEELRFADQKLNAAKRGSASWTANAALIGVALVILGSTIYNTTGAIMGAVFGVVWALRLERVAEIERLDAVAAEQEAVTAARQYVDKLREREPLFTTHEEITGKIEAS